MPDRFLVKIAAPMAAVSLLLLVLGTAAEPGREDKPHRLGGGELVLRFLDLDLGGELEIRADHSHGLIAGCREEAVLRGRIVLQGNVSLYLAQQQ